MLGKSQSMAITSLSHLSDKDIEKTVADDEQFAAVCACGEANSFWASFLLTKGIEFRSTTYKTSKQNTRRWETQQ